MGKDIAARPDRDGSESSGLNGWEATRRLKGQPETKHIPIIVLTVETSRKSRDDAIAAGCDDFLLKPIDFGTLIEKIRSLVGGGEKP